MLQIATMINFFKKRAQKKREKLGGRWELWILDYCGSMGERWFQWNSETRGRPHPLCRGTPVIEIYNPKGYEFKVENQDENS